MEFWIGKWRRCNVSTEVLQGERGNFWAEPPCIIDHSRVPPGLCFKTRVGTQSLIWKLFFILMEIKLISTRKVVHLASCWKWGFLELGSGLILLLLKRSPPAQNKLHYLLKCQSQGLSYSSSERERKRRLGASRRGPWFWGSLMLEIWDWFLLICIFSFFRFHFALDVEGQAFVYMHLKHEKCFISSCTTFSPCSSFSL